MAGIINIVLKKGSTDGFNGNIKFNGNHNEYSSFDKMHGMTAYCNYKKGKFNFFGSLGTNNKFGKRKGFRNTTTTYIDVDGLDDDAIDYGTRIDPIFYDYSTDTDRNNMNARFGLDYYLLDDITLTNEFKVSTRTKNSITTQEYQVIPDSWLIDENGEPIDFQMLETSIEEEGGDGEEAAQDEGGGLLQCSSLR